MGEKIRNGEKLKPCTHLERKNLVKRDYADFVENIYYWNQGYIYLGLLFRITNYWKIVPHTPTFIIVPMYFIKNSKFARYNSRNLIFFLNCLNILCSTGRLCKIVSVVKFLTFIFYTGRLCKNVPVVIFFNFYCVPEDFAKHFGIQYFNFHRSYRSRTEDGTMTINKCSISNITKSRSLSNSMKNSSSSIIRGIIPWGSLRNTMLYILFHSPPSISNVHMEWVWELFSWNWTVDIIEMLSLRMQRLDTSFKIELMPSSG